MPPYPQNGLSILGATAGDRPEAGVERTSGSARQSGMREASAESWSNAFARALAGQESVRQRLLGGAQIEALGSNNWVVDGTLTASGKPLLANDPHLATHVPSLWYLAHMSAGDFDVIGATLPGAPAMAIGRNRYIAWGETNVAADVEDLYRERVDPTGKLVEFRGALEPMRILKETITVNGGAPVEIDVRITRHGPLVSDAINANNAESKRGSGHRAARVPMDGARRVG